MSMRANANNMKVIQRAGMIERGREAQWRPCRLAAGPLKDASDWLEHYRRFWEEAFDRLEDYLRELQKSESEKKEHKNGRKKEHRLRRIRRARTRCHTRL